MRTRTCAVKMLLSLALALVMLLGSRVAMITQAAEPQTHTIVMDDANNKRWDISARVGDTISITTGNTVSQRWGVKQEPLQSIKVTSASGGKYEFMVVKPGLVTVTHIGKGDASWASTIKNTVYVTVEADSVEVNVTYHQNHSAEDAVVFTDRASSATDYPVKEGTAQTPGIAAPEGHSFAGWYADASCTGEQMDGRNLGKLTAETHLYAKWVPNAQTYTVRYLLKGTTTELAAAVTENALYGDTVDLNGYIKSFDRYLYSGMDRETLTVGADNAQNVVNLYYMATVAYKYEGLKPAGASALPVTVGVEVGTEVTLAPPATAEGYEFDGWYSYHIDNMQVGGTLLKLTDPSFVMPQKSVTIFGIFVPKGDTAYQIEHYLQNLDDPATYSLGKTELLSGTTGTSITAPPAAFEGFIWNGAEAAGEIQPDGGLVLKLYYDRESYEVSYNYSGDVPTGAPELPRSASFRYGEQVNLEALPVLQGYNFSGWEAPNDSLEITNERFTMPARPVFFEGRFTVATPSPAVTPGGGTAGGAAAGTEPEPEEAAEAVADTEEAADVMGARRDGNVTEEAVPIGEGYVLGARRSDTSEESQIGRIVAILIATVAVTALLILGKKKNKD